MQEFNCDFINLEQIADSGQCFRWEKIEDENFQSDKKQYHYHVPSNNKLLDIYQNENLIKINCTKKEFNDIWKNYLDLNTDYKKITSLIKNDNYLLSAIKFGYGIRVLNQNLWEMIISYIISQNNNIPRIKTAIKKLCSTFCPENKNGFPSPEEIIFYKFNEEEINEEEKNNSSDEIENVLGRNVNKTKLIQLLHSLGLGYRDEYIYLMSKYTLENPDWMEELKKLNYEEAFKLLISFKGIGKKVANCICLFGLHLINACPVDTWVQKIIDKRYDGIMPGWMKSEYGGIYQQYAFYYERFLSTQNNKN